MLIRKPGAIRSGEITPKALYYSRRKFLTAAGLLPFSGAVAAAATMKLGNLARSPFSTTEKPNSLNDITHYNNFYEFGTAKDQPAKNAQNFRTSPWIISVEGHVNKPRKFDLDQILKLAPLEERIYRMRCVEAWSVVVPWVGYSLSNILNQVEPTAKAKFVAFESYYDMRQMPMASGAGIPLPYVEGLRLDEAMHPLAMLATGLYGETLPPQNGAPVRLVVPWKYGFKGIKSIVKIRLVDKMPPTTWNISNPSEYGFYSNVNPKVDHPRWTQSKERRLGEFFRRDTLMFNGYANEVASLYAGMDLKKNY